MPPETAYREYFKRLVRGAFPTEDERVLLDVFRVYLRLLPRQAQQIEEEVSSCQAISQ